MLNTKIAEFASLITELNDLLPQASSENLEQIEAVSQYLNCYCRIDITRVWVWALNCRACSDESLKQYCGSFN